MTTVTPTHKTPDDVALRAMKVAAASASPPLGRSSTRLAAAICTRRGAQIFYASGTGRLSCKRQNKYRNAASRTKSQEGAGASEKSNARGVSGEKD